MMYFSSSTLPLSHKQTERKTQISESEDVKQVEKAKIEFQKRSNGDSQVFATAAVMVNVKGDPTCSPAGNFWCNSGRCGSTSAYCASGNCLAQCWPNAVALNQSTLSLAQHNLTSASPSASAHTLSKGDKEDVNQVEKAIMRDSQVYSTTAVKTTKDPDSPGANTGSVKFAGVGLLGVVGNLQWFAEACVVLNKREHTSPEAVAGCQNKGDKEDVNQVEKAIMRGDSRVLSTAAVKTTKDPKKRDADTGRDPQHNIVTTQEDNKKDTKQKEEKSK
ncbi:hypothetical protein SUGI_1078940 [Cryptomeria japonica]|nr:hypothetical protein SUGI_1078940 [Cryptomeria japonica]